MSFDGLAGVQARISEIQDRIEAVSAARISRMVRGQPLDTGFDFYYAQAYEPPAATATTATAAAYRATVSRSGAPPAPAELAGYGNGRIPTAVLAPIGIGAHRLWAPAAESFLTMRAAAAADGVQIGVTDSYRSYEGQVDVAERKGLAIEGGWAAVPGTSQHGWGRALDVDVDDAGYQWLTTRGAAFGWVQPNKREPWHWEFRPDSSYRA